MFVTLIGTGQHDAWRDAANAHLWRQSLGQHFRHRAQARL